MDINKAKKLYELGWGPHMTCSTCRYAQFQRSAWGICCHIKAMYEHAKHKRMHNLPAHRDAGCKLWEASPKWEEISAYMASALQVKGNAV